MSKSAAELLKEDSQAAWEETQKAKQSSNPSETKTETPSVESKAQEEPVVIEEKKETVTPVAETSTQEDNLQKLLKELNINSVDELKAKVNPTPQKSKEEEDAELIAYVTQNKLGSPNDFFEYEKVKSADRKELVYNEFAESLKKKDPNITDEKIQAKFDRKYGEKVIDEETGDEKIVYDQSDIEEAAEKIIGNKGQKIESFRKNYESYQNDSKFYTAIKKEAENLGKSIPKSIEITVGQDKFNYEIDETFRPQIEAALKQSYAAYKVFARQNGIADERFDISEAINTAVWNMNRQNILQTYANKVATDKVQEALKPFANPQSQTLETKEVSNAKVIPSDEEQIANIERQLGRKFRY